MRISIKKNNHTLLKINEKTTVSDSCWFDVKSVGSYTKLDPLHIEIHVKSLCLLGRETMLLYNQ